MTTITETTQTQKAVLNGYNHSMLSINVKDKNYICVPQREGHIDKNSSSNRVYIGKSWKDVVFYENAPIIVADDFNDFLKIVTENFGGLKNFFQTENGRPIKIFSVHQDVIPFFLYFLVQMDQVFQFDAAFIKDILKKTNERFWIWDNQNLGLSLELYQAFKESTGIIPAENLIFSKEDLLSLPFEYILLLYAHRKISKDVLWQKFKKLKSYMLGMSIIQVTRSGLETVLNDRRLLKEYNDTDILKHEDIIPVLEKDPLLNKLFFQRQDIKVSDWVEENLSQLKHFMSLLKKYDLDSHDPFPSYNEFNNVQNLYYGEKGAEALDDFFSINGIGLHELDFFKEYHHKMNTTLINYVSVKLSREGQD